jgi:protein gp37
MSDKSLIEWTDATWNPVTGCDRVSPGCDNCYALALARRLKAMGNPRYQQDGHPRSSGPGFGLTLHYDQLQLPSRWNTPRFVFVNSMSDLFHPRVPDGFVSEVFHSMATATMHTFQVLTKRPARMAWIVRNLQPHPLPNVWLGTSVESAKYLSRLDDLRATPAAIRFVSIEPLLGPVTDLDLTDIDWVIVGGESGPRRRSPDIGWIRRIRDACVEEGVPFFFKQWGGATAKAGGRLLDGREWNQMPMRMPIS